MAREITLGNGSTYIEKPSGQINIGRSEKKTAQQETPKKREKMTKDHQDLSPSNIKMNIIHLSDLHFGTLENASNWYSQLADDLKNKLNCSKLDIAILSGDIANKSTQKEYDAAEQFLKYLCQEFQLDTNHVVITPGNHDLNWSLSKKAYRIRRYEEYRGLLDEKGMPDSHYSIYKDKQDHIEVLNQENYKLRFKNFAKFYENIKGEPYPLEYSKQAIIHHYPEYNLLILGLNSAWELDHYYRFRVSILPDALSNAIDHIRKNPEIYGQCIKFAVWHHPLVSTGEDRLKSFGFMQRLAQNGFGLFLHGHVHKAGASEYRPEPVSVGGVKVHIICAGTFGAPTKEWEPGYPLQYNFIKLVDNSRLIVETRCRRELDGEWKPDAIWEPAPNKDPLPRYEIVLPKISNRYNTEQAKYDYKTDKVELELPTDKEENFDKSPHNFQKLEDSKDIVAKQFQSLEEFKKTTKIDNVHKSAKGAPIIKRVLIVAVCPKNTSPLRLDEEVREIYETLKKSRKFRFVVEVRWATQVEDLRESMLEFEPHIIHFSCHSERDGLVFEDKQGNPYLVSSEALTKLFKLFSEHLEYLIECVIMNACYTEAQSEAIKPYVGCIIGTSQAIGDITAIEFSKGFYSALASGKTFNFAFKLGCNAIEMAGMPGHLIPIMKQSGFFCNSLKGDNEVNSDYNQNKLDIHTKILVLLSNPKDTPKLRLDEEMREIYTVLRQASQQGQVVLEQRWAARFSDLQSALFKFKPTLIHFSGHGQSNGELVFENSIGMHHLVNARALSSLLKLFSNQVKCILLNANYSQIQAKEIVNFIDYSIGFSQETSEKACIAFSRGFYRALGEGVSLEEAYQLGCVELHDYDILEDQFPIFNRRN